MRNTKEERVLSNNPIHNPPLVMSPSELVWDASQSRVRPCVGGEVPSPAPEPDAARVQYRGSCHCGLVRFTVTAPRALTALDCNCSVCSKRGYLHLTVPRTAVRLEEGAEEAMVTYRFGSRVAQHTFCGVCGVQALYVPRSNPECWSVNVRCLELKEGCLVRVLSFEGRGFVGRLEVDAA